MPPRFIPAATANFRAGRPPGFVPEAVVLHRTGGSRDVLRARFNHPTSLQSAHYIVCRDGRVEQSVLETDTAFHAGTVAGATWPLLRANTNPNFNTIGIELEGAAADDWPDAQVEAAAVLIAEIARRWSFPIDAGHVVPHTAIRASSGCPAATCPIARIIETARNHVIPARVPRQTPVRTLHRTNLRRGAPILTAPIVRVLPADTAIAVSAFTDAGERVKGNPFWYGDAEEGYFWAGATDVPQPSEDEAPPADPDPGSTDEMERGSGHPPPLPDEPRLTLAVDRTTLVLPSREIVAQTTRKDLIVLHFTAGRSARSAFDTWRSDPRHIATSYIVELDGTVFEVFPPSFWASHLGISNSKSVHDRRSIGIEIVNVGPLQRSTDDPSALNWWPRKTREAPEFTTKFCGLDENDKYVETAYRGKSHFARYPDAQVDAVARLVQGLCEQFSIPATLPALARRFECDVNGFAGYKGVCSHANFRQDKWDIGPAFPWDRLGL
jgi:N-acetyl-anhydromuramyl-L-alanine amidase AmpD